MSLKRAVFVSACGWIVAVTTLHLVFNLQVHRPRRAESGDQFKVGFLPVTCHLTCPVTDFINKSLQGEGFFEPLRFNGFPELKETFLSDPNMPAL